MTSNEAQTARRGWRRFLPIAIRLSMARKLSTSWPWLAAFMAPETKASMTDRVAIAQDLIISSNSLAEWVAPEINIIAPAEMAGERSGTNH